jgi:bifunctional DNA-binding transcriptional regulator/antitoxin component of YhaV-PrlF toxin-antitoxin module
MTLLTRLLSTLGLQVRHSAAPLMLLALVPAVSAAQVPDDVRRAEEFTAAVEAAQRSPLAAQAFESRYGARLGVELIDSQLASVRAYLADAPEDAEAVLLSVRLEHARDGFAWQEGLLDPSADSTDVDSMTPPSIDRHLTIIDGILARHPASAPAHHWKARLLVEGPLLDLGGIGSWVPWAIRSGEPADWDAGDVLAHARRAVELDPASTLYREFLAVELALDGQVAAAADVMRQSGNPGDQLRLLIEYLDVLGMPPDAEWNWPLQGFLLRVALMGAYDSEDLRFIDNAEVRYGAWTVPMSLEQFEARVQARWPGMRFFTSSSWEGASQAALVMTPSGWTTVAAAAALEDGSLDDADVLVLLVLPPEVAAGLSEGMTNGQAAREVDPEQRLAVLFMNHRRGPWATASAEPIEPPGPPSTPGAAAALEPPGLPIRVATGPLEGPLYPVPGNGRIGLIDSLGHRVVEPRFSRIGRRGIIPQPGERDDVRHWDTDRSDWVTSFPVFAVLERHEGLLTAQGVFVPVEGLEPVDAGEAIELWRVRRGGRYGFVDSSGALAIGAVYDQAAGFRRGHAFVQAGQKWGIIDRAGQFVAPPDWDEVESNGAKNARFDLFRVRIGNRWGLVDRTGRVVLPARFERLTNWQPGDLQVFGFRQGDHWGVVDSTGTVLVPPRFEPVQFMNSGSAWEGREIVVARANSAPLIGVRERGRAYYVRLDGSVAFELTCGGRKRCNCQPRGFTGTLGLAECDGRPGVVDTLGRWIVQPTKEGFIQIVNDSVLTVAFGDVATAEGPPTPLTITVAGRVLDPGPPEGVRVHGRVVEGLRSVYDTQAGRFGFVDTEGRLVIPARFRSVDDFHDGLARARDDAAFGFIDRTGEWVLPPVWDRLAGFDGPLAFGIRQADDCSLAVTYFDRGGATVHTAVISDVTYSLSPESECARRLMRAVNPSGGR